MFYCNYCHYSTHGAQHKATLFLFGLCLLDDNYLYQRIPGDAMHARDILRQKQEAMIGCGVLNKMTSQAYPKVTETPKIHKLRHREGLRNNAHKRRKTS